MLDIFELKYILLLYWSGNRPVVLNEHGRFANGGSLVWFQFVIIKAYTVKMSAEMLKFGQ